MSFPHPSPNRALRCVGLAAAAAAFLGAVGCGEPSVRVPGVASAPAGAPPAAASAPVPGIVLLCVDTLRADAADGSEGARAAMPALDAFARGATAFSDATAASSWTAPSVATLLTGLEVAHTGVEGDWATSGPLLPSVTTLAEALRARGWSTYACTAGGWFTPTRGYDQGFDAFRTTFDERGPEAAVSEWAAARPVDKPFLLVLHTCAAHDPYGDKATPLPSPEAMAALRAEATRVLGGVDRDAPRLARPVAEWLVDRFLFDRAGRTAIDQVLGPRRFQLWARLFRWLDEDAPSTAQFAALAARARSAYREGLASTDRVVARALAALDGASLPADTVVAIVGDHGEGLGEHGCLAHGRWLHEELVRVPLFLRAPGRLPAGARVEGGCGLVDVMPTLLELAGAPVPDGLDGRSLARLARGEEGGHPVVSQEDRETAATSPARMLRVVTVRNEAAKFVLTFDVRTRTVESESLFDLRADPGEKTPTAVTAEGTGRYGDEFCRAVSRVRRDALGVPDHAVCGATLK